MASKIRTAAAERPGVSVGQMSPNPTMLTVLMAHHRLFAKVLSAEVWASPIRPAPIRDSDSAAPRVVK